MGGSRGMSPNAAPRAPSRLLFKRLCALLLLPFLFSSGSESDVPLLVGDVEAEEQVEVGVDDAEGVETFNFVVLDDSLILGCPEDEELTPCLLFTFTFPKFMLLLLPWLSFMPVRQ